MSPPLHPDLIFAKLVNIFGPLAQLAEQLTLNQQVTGSTPVRLTIFEANSTHFFSSPFSLVSILSSLLNKIPDFSLNFA